MAKRVYDDARYGLEKVLLFCTLDMSATGITTKFTITEDITVTELGAYVTTSTTGAGGKIALQESGTSTVTMAMLEVPTLSLAKTTLRQTTITSDTGASSHVLLINVLTANGSGVITPYIKYKERYV